MTSATPRRRQRAARSALRANAIFQSHPNRKRSKQADPDPVDTPSSHAHRRVTTPGTITFMTATTPSRSRRPTTGHAITGRRAPVVAPRRPATARLAAAMLLGIILALSTAGSLHSADVTLQNSDALGATSFNTGLNWSDTNPPAPGNDYFTSNLVLRTPEVTNNFTFQGDSLTINSGGTLATKTTGTLTINNLVLAGGTLSHFASPGVGITTIAGNGISVTANSSIATGGAGQSQRTWVINSPLSGTGNLTFSGDLSSATANIRRVDLAGNNAGYTGAMTINQDVTVRAFGTNALGGGTATLTINPNNAQLGGLELHGVTSDRNIVISGRHTSNTTALLAAAGSSVLNGNISLNTGGSLYALETSPGASLLINGNLNNTLTGTRTYTLRGGGSGEISGLITQGGSSATAIAVAGDGLWIFSRAAGNTYNSGTTISGGTLMINNTSGSGTGTGLVTVSNGGALAGSGIIGGATTVASGGVLSPGGDPGASLFGNATLTFNSNLNLDPGSITRIGIAAATGNTTPFGFVPGTLPAGSQHDAINVLGTLDARGILEVLLDPAYTPVAGDYFVIANYAALAGVPDMTLNLPSLPAGLVWNGDFTSGYAFLQITPEPGRALLLAVAALGLLLRRRR